MSSIFFLHRIQFQFSPLREGRPQAAGMFYRAALFQFSPLREGRPVTATATPVFTMISILAPA